MEGNGMYVFCGINQLDFHEIKCVTYLRFGVEDKIRKIEDTGINIVQKSC